MEKSVHNIFLLVVLFFGFITHAHAFTFTRTLSVGSTGQEVFELQKILNQKTETQIAPQGVGSPRQETYYFGELTKRAVIKFQNIYASQILTPLGLTQGTGFVGMSTINFLNTLQNTSVQIPVVPNTESSTTTNPIQVTSAQFFISPPNPQAGDVVYIGSEQKISDTTFLLDSKPLISKCFTDFTCEVRMPSDSPNKTSQLSNTKPELGLMQLNILLADSKKPETDIKSISLTQDTLITGKNFTPSMNIYTPFGQFNTQTLDNSFILNLGQLSNTSSTTGFLILENNDGLQSDILYIQYEN